MRTNSMRTILIELSGMMLLCLTTGASAEYVRSGPAAGGGLNSYEAPDFSVGKGYTSSEFRKMGCDTSRSSAVGRDSYYTCNGSTFKKDYVGGRMMYVVVSGVPLQ